MGGGTHITYLAFAALLKNKLKGRNVVERFSDNTNGNGAGHIPVRHFNRTAKNRKLLVVPAACGLYYICFPVAETGMGKFIRKIAVVAHQNKAF